MVFWLEIDMALTVYEEMGYLNRAEYLEDLAFDYGIELETVIALADILGPSEDFDGLIVALDDSWV